MCAPWNVRLALVHFSFACPPGRLYTISGSHCDIVLAMIEHVWSYLFWMIQASWLFIFSFSLGDRVLAHLFVVTDIPSVYPDTKPEASPEGSESNSLFEIVGDNFPMPQSLVTCNQTQYSASVPVQLCLRKSRAITGLKPSRIPRLKTGANNQWGLLCIHLRGFQTNPLDYFLVLLLVRFPVMLAYFTYRSVLVPRMMTLQPQNVHSHQCPH